MALLVLLAPSTSSNWEFSSSFINGESFGNKIQRHSRNLGILGPKDRISYILARNQGKITETALKLSSPLQMFKTAACKLLLGI